tara:strand:- start:865 stop:1170 length:306 start_codon:yes stop_codon:yes gene_type:complete
LTADGPAYGCRLFTDKAFWAFGVLCARRATKSTFFSITHTDVGALVAGAFTIVDARAAEVGEIRDAGEGQIGTRQGDGDTVPTLWAFIHAEIGTDHISHMR